MCNSKCIEKKKDPDTPSVHLDVCVSLKCKVTHFINNTVCLSLSERQPKISLLSQVVTIAGNCLCTGLLNIPCNVFRGTEKVVIDTPSVCLEMDNL